MGVRQKFTGYERDTESGLDYAQARYYAHTQGRFTSIDPLAASGRQGLPQSWNRYGYVLNNPLSLVDPTGLADDDPNDQEKKKQEQQLDNVYSSLTILTFRNKRLRPVQSSG